MARKRLNDTAAMVAQPPGNNENHSVTVRKIGNGFLVSTSSYNSETGEMKCSEQFSQNAPEIHPPRAVMGGVSPDDGSSLKDTMSYLNDKG